LVESIPNKNAEEEQQMFYSLKKMKIRIITVIMFLHKNVANM
jgi:hypothetical protein